MIPKYVCKNWNKNTLFMYCTSTELISMSSTYAYKSYPWIDKNNLKWSLVSENPSAISFWR
jgi:hypothetical protein